MGLNETPTSERVQIGLFGRVNAGKSSLLNALAGQEIAVVDDQEGTTTDPVRKAMELLPIGPVMLYDTPGLLDETALGEKRQQKTEEVLRRIDVGLIVVDAMDTASDWGVEKRLLSYINRSNLPFLIIANKAEGLSRPQRDDFQRRLAEQWGVPVETVVPFSCKEPLSDMGATELRERIAAFGRNSVKKRRYLVSDLLQKGDVLVLVVPIDESAPKGRLILPQQQVIRDALDHGIITMTLQPSELLQGLDKLSAPPSLVVTDSQAFGEVDRLLPQTIPLTSFSILMARYKGDLDWQAKGAKTIDHLKPGARILISEGCTHHRQCGDIGTVKLPNWIESYARQRMKEEDASDGNAADARTGQERNPEGLLFDYHFTSGGEFPADVSGFDLIIHCGGCTLPEREMAWRLSVAKEASVPMTNYGTMIAHLHGILERAMRGFGREENECAG